MNNKLIYTIPVLIISTASMLLLLFGESSVHKKELGLRDVEIQGVLEDAGRAKYLLSMISQLCELETATLQLEIQELRRERVYKENETKLQLLRSLRDPLWPLLLDKAPPLGMVDATP